VETIIASGNVSFESRVKEELRLRKKVETELLEILGYEVTTFVRTAAEVADVVRNVPFSAATVRDSQVINVGFLHESPSAAAAAQLRQYQSEVDDFETVGREIYWLCRIRQSESPFFKIPIEKKLATRITFRNLNTVAKIAEKYCAS
jgi:uncharacterized protein (DUF1697 family)